MVQTKDKYPESVVNPNFQKLLDRFHATIDNYPKAETIKIALQNIKEEANNAIITPHQRDAIHERCNNYAKGVYAGQSKKIDTRSDYSKSLT